MRRISVWRNDLLARLPAEAVSNLSGFAPRLPFFKDLYQLSRASSCLPLQRLPRVPRVPSDPREYKIANGKNKKRYNRLKASKRGQVLILFMDRCTYLKSGTLHCANQVPSPNTSQTKNHLPQNKNASLKSGFNSCIRVQYRFSCPSCKHVFFHQHYTYLIIIRPST